MEKSLFKKIKPGDVNFARRNTKAFVPNIIIRVTKKYTRSGTKTKFMIIVRMEKRKKKHYQ